MKRLLILLVVAVFMLTACQSDDSSLAVIENVPNHVQEHIDPTLQLQSINVKDGKYIVFHASGDVVAKLDAVDDTVIVKIDVNGNREGAAKQYVYYLATGVNHGTIDVHIDGKSKAFDSVTVI